MDEYTALIIIVFIKSLATIAAIAAACFLAYYEKTGWGWMIFLALCIGSSSIHVGPDNPDKVQKTSEVKSEL